MERHETPDPARSDAVNSRFHGVRREAGGRPAGGRREAGGRPAGGRRVGARYWVFVQVAECLLCAPARWVNRRNCGNVVNSAAWAQQAAKEVAAAVATVRVLAIIGSGETSPTMVTAHRELIA